uniref:Uncharacterized protein n=1 Tax=Triticum urartu TaxID=4572 RepID=A0A8R7QYW7_TRIUA
MWSCDVGYNRGNDLNWISVGRHAVSASGSLWRPKWLDDLRRT